jgi:hypothetical protein
LFEDDISDTGANCYVRLLEREGSGRERKREGKEGKGREGREREEGREKWCQGE